MLLSFRRYQQCFHLEFDFHRPVRRRKENRSKRANVGRRRFYGLVDLFEEIVAVLIDDTFLSFVETIDRLGRPPENAIAFFVVLPTVVVEAVRDFVSDHRADAWAKLCFFFLSFAQRSFTSVVQISKTKANRAFRQVDHRVDATHFGASLLKKGICRIPAGNAENKEKTFDVTKRRAERKRAELI